MVYTASIVTIFVLSTIVETSLYCARNTHEHPNTLNAINITMCGIVLLINPIIVGTVLKSLKSRFNGPGILRTMFIKIALLGCLTEIALGLRITLIYKQLEWKMEKPWLYNIVFSSYILIGEVSCQIVLISGVIIYTHKLRKKYLGTTSPPDSPRANEHL